MSNTGDVDTVGQAGDPGGVVRTGDVGFDEYAAALEAAGAPLLGYLVLYSVYDGNVTQPQVETWFRQLDLDAQYVPAPLRAVDAYERTTGAAGVRVSYPLVDRGAPTTRRGRRAPERQATLMIRHVGNDDNQIERHIVREERDQPRSRLHYDTHLGVVKFVRDKAPSSQPGAGGLELTADEKAIGKLAEAEQAKVRTMIQDIHDTYRHHCTFLSGDRLRTVVRQYVEGLDAVKIRKTGGVYFVHRQHAKTLGRLRELVARFGGESHLVRVPLADQAEMREMVTKAVTSKAADELTKLAKDIALAQTSKAGADSATVEALFRRFRELRESTAEHSTLLSTSLDETDNALNLVQAQLANLVSTIGAEDDDEADS